jgi:hypothetical protein
LFPDRSPVIFSRAFGQAADRAHEFAHQRFGFCEVLGSVLLFLVAKMRRKIFCKIKDSAYFTFLRCSTLKNLPMKKETI